MELAVELYNDEVHDGSGDKVAQLASGLGIGAAEATRLGQGDH
eukprot:gene52111-34591_t